MKVHLGDATVNCRDELLRAFDELGLSERLSRVSKVFVKPNLTFPHYRPGVTTSPKFLREVLMIAGEQGAEVFVGESNGGYGSFRAEEAFRGHGLTDLCRETKTTLLDLSAIESASYTRDVAGKRTTVTLPRFLVEDVDLSISIPVLKVHVMTTVSLSVKNLWGCCPLDLRLLQHAQIDRKLKLIVDLIKADYAFIDATYGLDKHGPMDGESRPLGKFIAGNDLYGLDWLAARMMGFKPGAIQHLQLISKRIKEDITKGRIGSNVDIDEVNWGFTLDFNLIDTLSLASFHSDTIARLIFDSPLTRRIYGLFGREPRRRLT